MSIDPVTLALTVANMALTASQKIEGPRQDTKFTSGDYGAALNRIYGMRRISPAIFFGEPLKEVKQQRKTKGGKYNDYTYFGTWAVMLANHPIQAVRRVWFDTHLAFDLSGAGPVTPFDFGQATSGKSAREISTGGKSGASTYFAIYLGTEDQECDPRILATTEAKQGEGTCPAYRGRAYIVFKDVPLGKLGNRIPQVSVELVAHGASVNVPTQQVADPVITTGWNLASYSPDFSRLLLVQWSTGYPEYEIWDVAARAPMIWGTLPFEYPSLGDAIGIYNDGTIMMMSDQYQNVRQVSPDGLISSVLVGPLSGTHRQRSVRVLADATGTEHWIAYGGDSYVIIDGAESALPGVADVFADSYGDIWALIPDGYTVTFVRLIDGGEGAGWDATITVTLPTSTSTVFFGHHSRTTDGDRFVFGPRPQSGTYYNWVFDPTDPSTVTGVDVGTDGTNNFDREIWNNIPPGAATYWVRGNEISLVTGAVVRTAFSSTYGNRSLYDPINHAIIQNRGISGTTYLIWNYLDRVSGDGIALGDIVADVCRLSGLSDDAFDVSLLTDIVPGYSCSQGSGKDWLEPLLSLYDVDARPHGFQLQFLPRGGAPGAPLSSESFALAEGGDGPLYSFPRSGGSDVPITVKLQFADLAADQQPAPAMSGPLAAQDGKRELSLDMSTLALGQDAARQLTGRYHRRQLMDRVPYTLSLPASQIGLEPADVHPLALRGITQAARLTSMVVGADRQIQCEWRRDDPSIHDLDGSAGADFAGREPSVIAVPLISKGFVLDVPLLTDAHNSANPLLYIGAAPYAAGTWPGATIFEQTTGGEYSDELGSVPTTSAATWGYTNAALPDANPNLWDRGSSVNVTIQTGALTGCTEAEIDATPTRNLALIGDELVNFTTATLEGDGTYTLSGFKRGRRGTEWATDAHATRDVFLLLSHVATAARGLSDVGTDMNFKAVTSGRTATSAFPISLAPFTGASLKPYAPCHLVAVKESNGDWTLSWVRRTRVGGAWTSGTTIPLGEVSEEYHLTVGDGASSDTKTVTSATTYLWSVAEQTTDTGAEVMAGDLAWAVAQISDAVGDGFLAEATA
jgi:hypothetical protein